MTNLYVLGPGGPLDHALLSLADTAVDEPLAAALRTKYKINKDHCDYNVVNFLDQGVLPKKNRCEFSPYLYMEGGGGRGIPP